MGVADLKILIVDDNEMNRWLLAEQMQYWSEDISQACDGREALALLQARCYDLVFLDVNMPEMSGCEVLKKIREQADNRLTPVIAVTAHAQNRQRELLIAEGFNDCLIKPIVLADLQRIVSQWQVPVNGSVASYAEAMLERVEHNRELARALLEKLFVQAPEQFEAIEQALLSRQYREAWEAAHKLHGTFCFYGFDDYRQLAEQLEQCLPDADIAAAGQLLRLLRQKFAGLEENRLTVLASLAE